MTGTLSPSEVWKARISRGFAAELRSDALILGLKTRSDVIRAALRLLHEAAVGEARIQSLAVARSEHAAEDQAFIDAISWHNQEDEPEWWDDE